MQSHLSIIGGILDDHLHRDASDTVKLAYENIGNDLVTLTSLYAEDASGHLFAQIKEISKLLQQSLTETMSKLAFKQFGIGGGGFGRPRVVPERSIEQSCFTQSITELFMHLKKIKSSVFPDNILFSTHESWKPLRAVCLLLHRNSIIRY